MIRHQFDNRDLSATMASLAARDQENLVNAHSTAAASKPLSQGLKGLQPKTPGNKSIQTPHRARFADENTDATVRRGKNGQKEDLVLKTGGKITRIVAGTPAPLVPRTILANKTTNAKAEPKNLTPGLGAKTGFRQFPRSGNRPPSQRKIKQSAKGIVKLRIPADVKIDNAPSSPEIEYMPPCPIPLPDIDDDLPPLDLSVFDGYKHSQIITDVARNYFHEPQGEDGLSRIEIQRKEEEEVEQILMLREEAEIIRRTETAILTCPCTPECQVDECKEVQEQCRLAEQKYEASMADLMLPREKRRLEREQSETTRKAKADAYAVRAPSRAGPSEDASRRAASALSMRNEGAGRQEISRGRDYPRPWLAGSKAAHSRSPSDGYASRHAAGVAAGKTNLGFRKGRSVSVSLRKTALADNNGKDRPRKTESQTLYDLWEDLERYKSQEEGLGSFGKDYLDELAENDFVLRFDP